MDDGDAKIPRVLLADDHTKDREALAHLLRKANYQVVEAASLEEVLVCCDQTIDLVITELNVGQNSWVEMFRALRDRGVTASLIIATAYRDVDSVVEALKVGAHDYLTKPAVTEILLRTLNEGLQNGVHKNGVHKNGDSAQTSKQNRRPEKGFEKIVGDSRAIADVLHKTRRAAKTESTILITGESGTGKELLAEAIHNLSPRHKQPFVTVNMAAVPKHLVESELFGHIKGAFTGATESRPGRFELADGGTIFIDEIGDFHQDSQAKLLRVLENRTVTPIGSSATRTLDVRVVAATSRSLKEMVAANEFRADLYYRLNVVNLSLPPLRSRRADIPQIVDHFLARICARLDKPIPQLSPELAEYLVNHDWPGNIRQLRNSLESMIVLSDDLILSLKDLPQSLTEHEERLNIPPHSRLDEIERRAVEQALEYRNGNRTHAAKSLGISVRTLQRKLKSWGMDEENNGSTQENA